MTDETPTYTDTHPVHGRRPELHDSRVGPLGAEVWSNTSVGGHRLTWRELAEAVPLPLPADLRPSTHPRPEWVAWSVVDHEGTVRRWPTGDPQPDDPWARWIEPFHALTELTDDDGVVEGYRYVVCPEGVMRADLGTLDLGVVEG